VTNKLSKTIRPEIKKLLKEVVPTIKLKDVRTIIDKHKYDIRDSVELAAELDKSIGGIGIHNVNVRTKDGHLTGRYDIEDRPTYRPIQYVYADLCFPDLEWRTRSIVFESCSHLEACLDRYCKEQVFGPFGNLLNSRFGKTLPLKLWNQLDFIRRYLYNPAKHYIPKQEEHLFSVAEAIAVYYICRKLGLEILGLIRK
jgi:hypothetical protein